MIDDEVALEQSVIMKFYDSAQIVENWCSQIIDNKFYSNEF